ncbi:MAG: alcohol dehydrogenase catalytic domain-containing protein [Hyphomicrobiaceae bacterium]|nr:MAG: alcohol dehydrogenase catalytic domain-containing protein [Hyphomicrobiaceae bacterium]
MHPAAQRRMPFHTPVRQGTAAFSLRQSLLISLAPTARKHPMHSQSLIDYGKPLQPTDAPTPTPMGTEVLLRVSHCGVCHSDIHLQDGYFDLGGGQKLDVRSNRPMPFTLGHEIAGTVEATGPEATGVAKGKRYAAYPWIGCGKCGLCARGDEHLCNAPRALGITVHGGYATHVVVPHPRYLLDVEGIAPEIAGALMCSGLTGYSAVKKAIAYLRAGPLLIVGLGGVGMMGLQFARALTDKPIYVADIDAGKREAAVKLGAAEAFDAADAGARKAIAKASGGGAGAVIDFAGSDKSLNLAQSVVAKGGAAIVVGLIGGSFTLPVPMFPLRALTVMGSYVGSPAEAVEMLALVKAGKVAPIPVELRPLDQTSRSLDDLRAGKIVGRVVVTP